jgi:putative endonuclease
LAHRFLQSCGYRILARNWRTRSGSAEVDIIALDGETIVFVEVKTRATDFFGAPEDAVDTTKRRHLMRAASEFLRVMDKDPIHSRFDIVSILFAASESIVHHPDAFAWPQRLADVEVTTSSSTYAEPI